MTPWQRAKKWLIDNDGEPFEIILSHYMNHGYVWSGDNEFILGKKGKVKGGRVVFGHPKPDCWFVGLAAGSQALSRFIAVAPEPLPYVAWQRHGRDDYHIYKWEDYKRRVKNGKHKSSSATAQEPVSGNQGHTSGSSRPSTAAISGRSQ